MPAGLILAGGRATRLGGRDKALLALGSGTLLSELLRRFAQQAAPVAISANGDPARFAAYGLPVLPDGMPDCGPLGGLLAGLHWAAALPAETLLSVPVDTPLIPAGLAARLASAPACAVGEDGTHVLVASWPTRVLPRLAEFLARGEHRVRDFAAEIGMREVRFAEAFCNINTPADLARARSLVLF